MKIIATIEIDEEGKRGKIFATQEEDGYKIFVRVPGGKIEIPAIKKQDSLEKVYEAIGAAWGGGHWDLYWKE